LQLIARDCIPGGTRSNLASCEDVVIWKGATHAQRVLFADAQTSGGLLLCVAPARLTAVRAVLKAHKTPIAEVIGRIVKSHRVRIVV
jgi:selenide,water dikinase